MAVDSTRLRYISAGSAGLLSLAVSRLPFKVEIKQLVEQENRWFAWFVIPDHVADFQNVDLDG